VAPAGLGWRNPQDSRILQMAGQQAGEADLAEQIEGWYLGVKAGLHRNTLTTEK